MIFPSMEVRIENLNIFIAYRSEKCYDVQWLMQTELFPYFDVNAAQQAFPSKANRPLANGSGVGVGPQVNKFEQVWGGSPNIVGGGLEGGPPYGRGGDSVQESPM